MISEHYIAAAEAAADAKALVTLNASTLDHAYVGAWAARLGLEALWAEAAGGEVAS